MPSAPPDNLHDLLATMKCAAAALRSADVEFMVGGGIAIWARGGPPTDHDVDFLVREEDAERALEALVLIGMRAERPPEDWLFKAWDGPILVDLIFRPAGGLVDDEQFARATPLEVSALTVAVASIDDVLVTKLLALARAGPRLPCVARDRSRSPRADRLARRRRTDEDVAVRTGFLHDGRGAGSLPARF